MAELGSSERPLAEAGPGACSCLPRHTGRCSQGAGAMPTTDLPGGWARAVQGGLGRRPDAGMKEPSAGRQTCRQEPDPWP